MMSCCVHAQGFFLSVGSSPLKSGREKGKAGTLSYMHSWILPHLRVPLWLAEEDEVVDDASPNQAWCPLQQTHRCKFIAWGSAET